MKYNKKIKMCFLVETNKKKLEWNSNNGLQCIFDFLRRIKEKNRNKLLFAYLVSTNPLKKEKNIENGGKHGIFIAF